LNKNVQHWIYALTSKYISGGAGSVTAGFTASFIAPAEINLGDQFWHFIELVVITFIVNGVLNAMQYLKDNPLPQDPDDNGKNDKFTSGGGIAMILVCLLMLTGCSTMSENEPKAHQIASWVSERQGFIENAVAAITQVAVYSTEKDSIERTNTLLMLHVISSNLNGLITSGNVDADSLKEAFRVDQQYFTPVMNAVVPLVYGEIQNFKNNGYGDVSIEILKAVSLGIKDGSITQ
jgi:hypothetical protein